MENTEKLHDQDYQVYKNAYRVFWQKMVDLQRGDSAKKMLNERKVDQAMDPCSGVSLKWPFFRLLDLCALRKRVDCLETI